MLNQSPTGERYNNSVLNSIKKGYFSHVRYLLENDLANPNETSQSNYNTMTPSNKPFMLPILNILRSQSSLGLAHNVPSIQSSSSGRTPLIMCTFIEDDHWSYNIAQNLIEKGGIIGKRDHNGLNALMYACLNQKESLFRLYAKTVGDYSLSATDNFGSTVMHMASLGQNESLCMCLQDLCLKYGLNILQMKNKFGHTPFDLCLLMNHKKCIDNYAHFSSKNGKSPHFKTEYDTYESRSSNMLLMHRTPTNLNAYHTNESPRQARNVDQTSLFRKDLVDFYKQAYMLKEKFIKTNPTADLKRQATNVFPRSPTLLHSDFQKSNASINSGLHQASTGSFSIPSRLRPSKSGSKINAKRETWRSDMKRMLAMAEQQNTDSYRKSQPYHTMLEQLNAAKIPALDMNKPLNSRRMSTMLNPIGRRMSIVNRPLPFGLANKTVLIS
jgi:ankyrin repeat protein